MHGKSYCLPIILFSVYGFALAMNVKREDSLYWAASNGNLKRVKSLLTFRPELVNELDFKYGQTALHWAVSRSQIQIISVLLASGADVNLQSKDGKTPLHRVSDVHVAQQLLQAGANPNIHDHEDGKSPLHWAAGLEHREIVAELLKAGADINAIDGNGKTALQGAVQSGDFQMVEFLLEQEGIDVHAQDFKKERDAIGWALRMCKGALEKQNKQNSIATTARMIIALIKRGADPESLDKKRKTPDFWIEVMRCTDYEKNLLHMAVQYNSLTDSHKSKLQAILATLK